MTEEKKNGHDESATEQLVPPVDGEKKKKKIDISGSMVRRSQSIKKFTNEVKQVEGPKGLGYHTIEKIARAVCIGIGAIVSIAFTHIVSILMLIVGAYYINKCSAQPYIPIYLIVAGVFALAEGILNAILVIITRLHHSAQSKVEWAGGEPPQTKYTPVLVKIIRVQRIVRFILGVFGFVWLIVGSVWVYSIFAPETVETPKNMHKYCHPCPYYFTFAIITIGWILAMIAIPCLCCLCCCALCRGVLEKKRAAAPPAEAHKDEEKAEGGVTEKIEEKVEMEMKKEVDA